MPKLLWVLLPLLGAAALLGVLALRRRLPSRHALNVGFSLLLLAYVAGTASLGLFWVANQQLPVFDWHYLFGYATLVLLALHLVFNFRVVWQFLRGAGQRKAATPAQEAPTARRPALAVLALGWAAAGAGVGYLLGLRHGRTEITIDMAAAERLVARDTAAGAGRGERAAGAERGRRAAGAGGDDRAASAEGAHPPAAAANAAALLLVEQFHAFSAHSRLGTLRHAPSVQWGDPPPSFKRYRGLARLALPPPQDTARQAIGSVGPAGPLDPGTLGSLLWHCAGVSLRRGGLHLRTSPSSGALFATELYVAVRAGAGAAPGLWHYDAQAHALHRLREEVPAALQFGIGPGVWAPEDAALVLATAVFRRSGHKYRDRTYRYVLADLGHALENLRAGTSALGLRARLLRRFDESRAAATLGVDEAEEGVLALLVLHGGAAPAATSGAALEDPGPGMTWRAAPLGAIDVPAGITTLGVTEAMHRASSLRLLAMPPGASRPAAPPGARPDPRPAAADSIAAQATAAASGAGAIVLPPAARPDAPALQLMARRRSLRRYAAQALPVQDLSTVLAAMAQASGVLSDAVRIHVLAQDVQGLESAAWRYDPAGHALQRSLVHGQPLRARSRSAALAQDVIGEAAAVFVLTIDRATFAADPSGPARGYRHAFLQAGLAGERLYLAAGALGLGVCAVGAFYDDEAAALLGIDRAGEWVVHFAALGVPA